jgi:hypothetical protein
MLKKELQELLLEKEAENNMLWNVIKELGVNVEQKQRLSEYFFGKIEKTYLFELDYRRYIGKLLIDETHENRF